MLSNFLCVKGTVLLTTIKYKEKEVCKSMSLFLELLRQKGTHTFCQQNRPLDTQKGQKDDISVHFKSSPSQNRTF